MTKSVVALLSGGLDSSVMLADLVHMGVPTLPLFVSYGQRHGKEFQYAKAQAERLGLPIRQVDLSGVYGGLAGNSQTDPTMEVPRGHYADDTMRATVVPGRNLLILGSAAAVASAIGASGVAYAAHAGDHPIYPDCRENFVKALALTLARGFDPPIDLLAPFVSHTKADIVRLGASLGVPFELTWSCYCGRELHCGLCGTCVERREAFELAGVKDPTEYEVAP